MKKLLFSLFLVLLFPSQVFGHAIGQPPYLKINGEFTDYYNVPTTSLPDFILPNDISKQPFFLVNQEIYFEIDKTALPIPPELLDRTRFIWEFGDGARAEGLSATHVYTKPGTYFADLKVDSGTGFAGPQSMQLTAINIVSDANYKLPKAVIEVNGKSVSDPLLDLIDVDFNKRQEFNGSRSESGEGEIISFLWDLGDMEKAEGSKINYVYQNNPYTVFPVLRIKTSDGFISDVFVQIKDEAAFETAESSENSNNLLLLSGIILGAGVLAVVITGVIYKLALSKKRKH